MNAWSWEYMSDAEYTLGSLPPKLIAEAEYIAQRLVDAADIKYIGEPPVEESGVSGLLNLAEGRWMIWYQEDWRRRKVFIVLVQHLGD